MLRSRRIPAAPAAALLVASLLAATPALLKAQAASSAPPTPTAPPPTIDWTPARNASARIEVMGPGGSALRQTFGVVLGEPGRLVMRLTDLAGAEKIAASFRIGSQITAERVYAIDPVNDIAVLDTDGTLPLSPVPDQTIKWKSAEHVFVIPGPGQPEEMPEQTSTEPFELDPLHLVPVTGDFAAGLAVMHNCGRWIGLTGVISDPSGKFVYMTPKEAIFPLLFGAGSPKPIAAAAAIPAPDWMGANNAKGLLVRAVLTAYQKPEAATPFFDLALARDRTLPELHFWMGKTFFRQQRFADAEASFLEAARLRPKWDMAYYMAGAASNQQGHYDAALQHYNDALKISPRSAMILNNKWGALYNLGRMQESVDALKEALDADPTYSMALYNLGVTYLKIGRRVDAEEQYNRLAAIDKRMAADLRTQLDSQ